MSGGGGFLLEKGTSPNCLDSEKEGTAPSMSRSKRTPTSRKSLESSRKARVMAKNKNNFQRLHQPREFDRNLEGMVLFYNFSA